MDVSRQIMRANAVNVETIRAVDHEIAFGVYPDMTEHGCAMNILYSLQHIGYTIPPQADAARLGEAGPGPSFLDAHSGGPSNDFTQRNTTFMTWNLLHLARMLKDVGGVPAHGNQRSEWEAGCRFDHPNPDYR